MLKQDKKLIAAHTEYRAVEKGPANDSGRRPQIDVTPFVTEFIVDFL